MELIKIYPSLIWKQLKVTALTETKGETATSTF